MPFGRRGTCILPFKTTESDMIGVIRGDALHFEALASNPRGAQTMVCAAAAQGWNGAIGVMLDEYSDYFTADGADVKNYTPLGRAAMNGRVSTIELLIDEYGAGVDVPNNAGPSFLGGGGWFDGDGGQGRRDGGVLHRGGCFDAGGQRHLLHRRVRQDGR